MCQFKSAIVLKDRVYVPDHDHHSDMLDELGIPDDFAHASKVFVRVEVSPTDGDILSDVFGWRLKVDQDILPDWWDAKDEAKRVKDAIKAWCDKHILREGVHEVKEGVWYACNSSTVTAYGSSTVILPKLYQICNTVDLHDEAICVNHKTKKIGSAVKWKVE